MKTCADAAFAVVAVIDFSVRILFSKLNASAAAGPCRRRGGARGFSASAFTLLEVTVAVGVLVLFLAGFFAASSHATNLLGAQRDTVAASQMLQERTEAIRRITFSELTDAAFVQNTLLASPASSAILLNGVTEVLTISAYPGNGSPSLQATRKKGVVTVDSNNPALAGGVMVRVDLQLTWNSANGRPRARSVSTIVAKGGINL